MLLLVVALSFFVTMADSAATACPDLVNPTHGTGKGFCSDGLPKPGKVCSFGCHPGYRIQDGSTAVLLCLEDGTWDAPVPTCTATTKCSDVLEGAGGLTWRDLCARGKNMVCLDHPNQDPECVCADGYTMDDLGFA